MAVGTITGINMNGASKGTSGVVDLGTVITSHQDISGKENITNKTTSVSSASTDTQYPSAKAVYDSIVFEKGSGANSAQLKGTGSVASGAKSVAEGGDNIQGQTTPDTGSELLYARAEGYASHAEGAAHAIGKYSHAEGGGDSIQEGYKTVPTAEGSYSHAEGTHTYAKGSRSHAEGLLTQALGDGSHAEGYKTIGRNANDHAEGLETVAEGWGSHAEGELSEASAARSHTEGYNTKTGGSDTTNSRTTGTVAGGYSHAEGNASIANGQAAHAEGTKTLASNHSSHAEGNSTVASGLQAHAEGLSTTASGPRSHAEGNGSQATGSFSHAENRTTIAQGHSSHAEGYQTVAGTDAKQAANGNTTAGYFTHAEGNGTRAYGNSSHAEGKDTQANGLASHVEGNNTTASGDSAHAEGKSTKANGEASHAEGVDTKAIERFSHAEGGSTTAFGECSHAEGNGTTANGYSAHAEGRSTTAQNTAEHAEGQYNVSNRATTTYGNSGNTQHSVGIGTGSSNRKNAFEIMQNGDAYLYGVGGYDGTNATASTSSTLQQVLSNVGCLTEITWSNLKSLRDSSGLTPGMQYRITDYNTTTTQANTQSAGHQFDIIVVADDNHTLNENARAIRHAGDTYFSGATLEAWELKYDIDNDTTKYSWADTGATGRGVIYWMKDEWNNECPYDFKNIQFKRFALDSYAGSGGGDVATVLLYSQTHKHFGCYDAYNNNVPQNFDFDESEYGWYYTFSGLKSNYSIYDLSTEKFKLSDASITTLENEGGGADISDRCDNNVIKPLFQEYFGDDVYYKGRYVLNNIVFIGDVSYDEGDWDWSVSLIYGNVFDVDCRDNTFGNDCGGNTFGNNCYSNTFGNNCGRNTFGNNFQSNTFGNYCYSNTFGNECFSNTFGNNFQSNTFGNECQYINVQKAYVYYIIVENGNKYINITSTQTTSSSNILRNFTISQGVNNTTTRKTISHNTVNDTFKTTYQPANSQIISV